MSKNNSIDVAHVAKLARLELSEEELKMLPDQVASVLDYIGRLSEADTTEIVADAYITTARNVLREDVVIPCDPAIRDACIEAFPSRKGNLLEVEAIFEDDTE